MSTPLACRTLLIAWLVCPHSAGLADEPWRRHAIDSSSRGADGVRVADVNGDGFSDLTTGWEEGGVIRVYLHPGPQRVRSAWPAVTVGQVKSAEDAVLADIDGDGSVDVISCCEGKTRAVFIHWAPRDAQQYLDPDAWTTTAIPCTQGQQMWMFSLPMQVDGRHGVDLVVGSKGPQASVSWLAAPANPRDAQDWQLRRIYDAGWIMSLRAADFSGDGQLDVLVSDRKGASRGILWLEHPGRDQVFETKVWQTHRLGGDDREVMFLDIARPAGDQPLTIFAAVRGRGILSLAAPRWQAGEVHWPENCGTGKGVAVGDVDLNGSPDLVFSCENASGSKSGVRWLSRSGGQWGDHEISGPEGIKFDRLELLDLDRDGDLDVVTCEERANLGVIWYENPTR